MNGPSVAPGNGSRMLPFGAKLLLAFLVLNLNGVGVGAVKFIKEVNHGNLEEFLDGKFFVLTYVDATGCSRCRNQFPFFVAASQSFHRDEDIFFTRTYDNQLIKEWDIQELPALVYHRKGVDSSDVLGRRAILNVDMTVDDIIDGIERTLHGDFEGVHRKYSVQLDPENFDEMVTTPTQSVMLLFYDEASKEETLSVIESVAYNFRKDDAILFTSLDIDDHSDLRESRYKTKDVPSVLWFEEKNKRSVKRYGGMITEELMTTFVNERTGLHRVTTGGLYKEAGRIAEVDELIDEHADIVYHGQPESMALLSKAVIDLKPKLLGHQTEMLDYYLALLDQLAGDDSPSSVLDERALYIHAMLYGDEELNTKTEELLKRQKNVVHYFQSVIKSYKTGEWSQHVSNKDRLDAKVTLEAKHHVHTEL